MAMFGSLVPEIDPMTGNPIPPAPAVPQNRPAFGALSLPGIDPMTGMAFEPSPRAQANFGKIADHYASGIHDMVTMPGRAAGTYGEPPTEEEMRDWAPGMALSMIGGARLPGGAPAGSVGAGGAKLVQPEGIRAYHGSPHDFERFDLGKIGTGEGAQAYGHGLYFAENEGVASSYKHLLSQAPRVNGRLVGEADGAAEGFLYRANGDIGQAIEAVENTLLTIGGTSKIDRARAMGARMALDKLNGWKDSGAVVPPGGRMYEVNISAKPEQFLDWDKPLSQMPPEMQTRLKDAWLAHPEAHSQQSGAQIYGNAGSQSGMVGGYATNYASRALEEAGIPGIRYLDQGSRQPLMRQELAHVEKGMQANEDAIARVKGEIAANQTNSGVTPSFFKSREAQLADLERTRASLEGQRQRISKYTENGTSNYVVFSPEIIQILRKYGLAGMMGGAGAAAVAQGDAQAKPFGSLAP